MIGCWMAVLCGCFYLLTRLQAFRDETTSLSLAGAGRDAAPLISIVVAARDEAAVIGPALAKMLEQDAPRLELVAVNDRSRDETGQIIDALTLRDTRITAVHVQECPHDWLGKVHALREGALVARGEWLLFTDADVHLAPDVVRLAVAYCEREQLDHLALLTSVKSHSFWLDIVYGVARFALFTVLGRGRIDDPASEAYVGIGAFNLVRRAVLERSEGFEWLRLETLDDMGLGLCLKRAGARQRLLTAGREVEVEWYPDLAAFVRGVEKNVYGATAGYSPLRCVLATAGQLAFVFVAPLALWIAPSWWMASAWLIVQAGIALLALRTCRPFSASAWPLAFYPLAMLLMAWCQLRAMVLCHWRGGIVWRGSRTSLAALKAGRRVGVARVHPSVAT